jgi:hypothetical protein
MSVLAALQVDRRIPYKHLEDAVAGCCARVLLAILQRVRRAAQPLCALASAGGHLCSCRRGR